VYRNLLLVLMLMLSLCLPVGIDVRAGGPIRVISSATRNDFPSSLTFELAVEDEASDVVSIQLSFRMRGQGSETVAPLEFTPGREVRISYRWNTQKITVPPGVPIEYYWLISDGAGNRLRTETSNVHYDDIRFDWQVRENKDVAVFWYGGGQEAGRRFFDSAASALERLSATTETQLEFPIRIVVYASETDFRSAFPYLNEWVGGRAFTEAALIVLFAESDPGSLDWTVKRGIPHEIAHILFHQATEHPYSSPPTWLNEGLAMHSEEAAHDDERALVRRAVQLGELLSLAQISGGFPPDSEVAALSYAESLSAVEFILDRYGPETVPTLLRAFKEGHTTDEATRQAFGLSLEEFEIEWKEYLAQEYLGSASEPVTVPAEAPRFPVPMVAGGLLCCGGLIGAGSLLAVGWLFSRRGRA
jgi:hypothetical protein